MKRYEQIAEGVSLVTETLSDASEVFGVHLHGGVDFACVDQAHAVELAWSLANCVQIDVGLEGA